MTFFATQKFDNFKNYVALPGMEFMGSSELRGKTTEDEQVHF
jgi:hypothetical protein